MIYDSILAAIGKTPLIRLAKLKEELTLNSDIYAKVEFFNPSGSIKDRAAYKMISEALKKGLIKKDTVIIEESSGNMGISLSMIAARLGLKLIIVMPDSMSKERIKMMEVYGAKVVLSDGSKGMQGAKDKVEELKKVYPDHFLTSQFENPDNPLAHFENTAEEIVSDLGKIDYFVAGIGTGGTISGAASYFKKHFPDTKIIGVEPETSPLLSKGQAGAHKIQGIGANFIPEILKSELIDRIETVSYEEAIEAMRSLHIKEGIFSGISSGAALAVALKLAKEKDKKIVVILPDSFDRYLSLEGIINEDQR